MGPLGFLRGALWVLSGCHLGPHWVRPGFPLGTLVPSRLCQGCLRVTSRFLQDCLPIPSGFPVVSLGVLPFRQCMSSELAHDYFMQVEIALAWLYKHVAAMVLVSRICKYIQKHMIVDASVCYGLFLFWYIREN